MIVIVTCYMWISRTIYSQTAKTDYITEVISPNAKWTIIIRSKITSAFRYVHHYIVVFRPIVYMNVPSHHCVVADALNFDMLKWGWS